MTGGTQIRAKDLTFCFRNPRVCALDNISFEIPKGSFVAVLGPNGSGKTTLLKHILGLLKPDSGTVEVNGIIPWQNPQEVQNKIGYVPQQEEINTRLPLRVREVVLQGFTIRSGRHPSASDSRQRLLSVLEMVGLEELSSRPFNALSGGQQQRALIARALAVDPAILLLDEPFSAVDVSAQLEISELMREISHKNNVTIVAVVHNINQLVHYLDSVMLLNKKLIAYGPPDEVLLPEILKEAYGVDVPVVICEDGYRHPIMEDTHGTAG